MAPRLAYYLRLWATLLRTSLIHSLTYRSEVLSNALIVGLILGRDLSVVWIVYRHTETIHGWTVWELLALLGVFHLVTGLVEALLEPNLTTLVEEVREGTFDFVLAKPASSQFLASFRRFDLWHVVTVLQGVGLVAVSVYARQPQVEPLAVARFLVSLLAGALVVYAFWVALMALTFRFVRIENLYEIFFGFFEAGRWPVDIYPWWLREFLTFVVPVAIVTTLPADMLRGQLGWPSVGVACGVALAALLVSGRFWQLSIRSYSGASA